MKKMLLFACAAACTFTAYAQSDSTKPKTKKLEHHVGVQVNELVRQIFNLGNAATVTNPYLLTYNIQHIKTGLGLRLGAGYNLQTFANEDGITKRTTDINKMSLRFGVEKVFKLSGRWTTGVGLDGLYGTDYNNTETNVRSFDTTTTVTITKVNSLGGGAMCWLRYNVTKNIVIGTEMSFYYTSSKKEQEVTITDRTNTFPTKLVTTTTKLDSKNAQGAFNLPMVLYLFVRF